MSHGDNVRLCTQTQLKPKWHQRDRKREKIFMCSTDVFSHFLSVTTTASGVTPPHCWPPWSKLPFLPLTWGLVLTNSQHRHSKGARQAVWWFIGLPMAMLSLGEQPSSKAYLLLVLLTRDEKKGLNYLRFPLGKYRNQEGCLSARNCAKNGRQEKRNGSYWETEARFRLCSHVPVSYF